MLTKLKKHGGLFKFLKSLSAEEGYLITKKLDECDAEPTTEFSNDLYDGSEKFLRMKQLLMKLKSQMLRQGLGYILNRIV